MKKETPLLIVLGIALFFIVILIIKKNKTMDNVPYMPSQKNETAQQQVRTPTTVPSISNNKETNMKKQYDAPPEMQIDAGKKYQATFATSEGEIVVELYADRVPKTVNNFVFLANEEFYNETIFHRAIDGFMIQGGDPEGTGMGGPGYRFDDEEFQGSYTRGTIAMANAGPNTNGSQFFIMHQDYPLPTNYVIFGKVVEGIEVVDKIATAPVSMSMSGEKSQPVEPVTVQSIVISE